tara:strand:- start:354 stop:683 length:330 start_codon:yes stop_codon:yes gene_type:complete
MLDEEDYKKIIDNKKSNKIKIQFPYGINGIMSDIYEYTIDEFNVKKLIDLIKEFYNSKLTNTEKKKIAYEAEIYTDDLKIKKDILKLTNQCFVEELEYKNGVFILRIGS